MAKLSTNQRNKLTDSDFGIPEERMYPLHDKAHVESAVKLFGHAKSKYKKSLARRILSRAKEYGLDTSGWKQILAFAQEQVPPMSDGTSIGNSPPRLMAPYYDEQDELLQRVNDLDGVVDPFVFAKNIVTTIRKRVDADSKPPTGNQNCQLCTWCAEADFRGRKVLPRPIYSPRDPALNVIGETIVMNPVRESFSSQRDVIERVRGNVDSRWYVHVNWKDSTGGHEFLVVNIKDYAYIMDAQAGILKEIDETDSTDSYFRDINFDNSYMVRLDDKPFNDKLFNEMNDISKLVPWDESLDIPYMREHGMLGSEDEKYARDRGMVTEEDEPVQEAACVASLLTVKNQLTKVLSPADFEFIGGSMIPKFTIKSKEKPDVSFEVNVNGQNIEVTPAYKGIPDMLHKRRGIAIMRAANIIADFVQDIVNRYKPVQESFMDEYTRQYTMRKAKDSDLDFVYQSELETVGENKDDPKVQRYIKQDAKDSLGHTKIIVVDGKDVGVYQAYETNQYGLREGKRDWWYLAHIYIKSEYRNLGIGSDIIKNDIKTHDKILLQVMKSNKRAKKLYESLGFVVDMENDHGGLVMRLEKSKITQEGADIIGKARDMTLMPVSDFKYDKVFYGDPTNGGSVRALNGKPLFVTPYPGLASIFLGRRQIFRQLSQMGYHEVNLGYDEWGELGRCDQPLTDVHVYVKNQPDLKPFTAEYDGYLHTIDCSHLKENIFRYPWMSDPDHKVLIAKVPEVKIENVQRLHIRYHVRGIPGKVPETPYQEGAIMDFKDDELLSVLKNSKYGVAYHDKLITNPSEQDYMNKWHCLSPNEFINIGGGVCYDFVEWESDYLEKHQIPFKKFHISHHIGLDKTDVGKDAATHSICVAIVNGKYMYIEGSSKKLAKAIGYIKEFNNIDELLDFAVKHTLHGPEQSKLIIIDYTNVDNLIGLNLFDYQNRIFSKGKVITSDFVQEGASQDLRNGVNPYSDKLVFHVSPDKHLDGQVWQPRVPEYLDPYNPDDTGFEDNTSPRICFSTSIEGALNGITVNIQRQSPDTFDKMYVYIPEKPWKEYKHKTNKELVKEKLVYDANVTREVWITEPVRMKLYGVIRVDQVSKMKRKSVVPTASGIKDKRNYYTYKWHWVVKPKVLDKATRFDYSVERVLGDLCIDIKKFRYGLIKDGRLMTGNVSDKDYDKYWVFHSGQTVDEAGGGNCYDMVEYEAGYLDAFGVPYKKYFINCTTIKGKDKPIPTHTICVVPHDGKFIYIEQAFKRVVDEWGYERKKTFDKLNDVFDYVAECIADYENQDVNFGVWDYTDAKIDYGTPMKNFLDWIFNHCKMIYDGATSTKKSVTKEGYHMMDRFGNRFFTEAKDEEMLTDDMEDITIGDLNLEDDKGEEQETETKDTKSEKKDDEEPEEDDSSKESKDDGPMDEVPSYLKDRMSEEDLEDFEQPDENISARDVDLGSFGKDQSDVQNDFDPKEVTILMKLMASEADAMNEYMDGAKETNVDVLRRLYADIANEERFHMEQLLFAKCELTGEQYQPKDPEVKSEYEELLKMGMDEETAMQTAVDKCHIRGSISEDDDEERVELQADVETMEMQINMFNALYDQVIAEMESGSAKDVNRAYDVFIEATYDATAASSETSPLSETQRFGPLKLIRDGLRFLIKTLMMLIRKFSSFCKRLRNRSRETKRFIKNYGWEGLFDNKYRMYFVDFKDPRMINDSVKFLLSLACDTMNAALKTAGINDQVPNNLPRNPRMDIHGNVKRGIELLNGVQLIKSPMVLPKDDAERNRIAEAFFGYNEIKGTDAKSINVANSLQVVADDWIRFLEMVDARSAKLSALVNHQTSIYYTNKKQYDLAVRGLEAVTKTCKAMVAALQNDINVVMKLNNEAAAVNMKNTNERDKQDMAGHGYYTTLSQDYEKNYRRVPDRFKEENK